MNNNFYPMTAAELLDRAVDVYRKSFGRQIGFAAIFGIISSLFFVFVGIVTLLAIGTTSLYTEGNSDVWVLTVIAAAAVPLFLLWASASSAGHILISRGAFYDRKENLPVGQLPRIACRVFGVLIAQVLASLPFTGLVYICYSVGFLAFLLHNNIWVFVIFIFVFFVIYLFYLNIFSLGVAIATFERRTFFSALARSWQLLQGECWKIAGLRCIWFLATLVIWAVFYGALSSAGLAVTFLTTLLNVGAGGGTVLIVSTISGLLSFAITFAITPLDGVFQATLYFNQRIKKEGLDIEAKLERLLS